MKKFKQASKAEFEEFIESYPNKLESHTSHIITPPIVSFNDFSLGKFPESIVATISMGWLGDDGRMATDENPKEFWTYAIKE
jgi:hypothetical protein